MDEDERLYTMTEVSDLLRVHRVTVYHWRRRGHLQAFNIAPTGSARPVMRVRQSEVARLLGGGRDD